MEKREGRERGGGGWAGGVSEDRRAGRAVEELWWALIRLGLL